MIATWIPAAKTPLTFREVASAMRLYLAVKLGKDPAREVLALALAKTALETGRFQSIYHYNFGNIKAGATYLGSYCTIELNEVIGSKVVWFSPRGRLDHKGGSVVAEPYNDPPGHPQTRLRSYASAIEGVRGYVDFVASGRYAEAWLELLAGDAVGYVRALKEKGYFTAPELQYRSQVVSLQREYIRELGPAAPPVQVPQTLRRGANSPDVAKLQEALNRHGAFPPLKVDGDFGKKTYDAVRIFQQGAKQIADGVVGPRTWSALLAGTPPAPAA